MVTVLDKIRTKREKSLVIFHIFPHRTPFGLNLHETNPKFKKLFSFNKEIVTTLLIYHLKAPLSFAKTYLTILHNIFVLLC